MLASGWIQRWALTLGSYQRALSRVHIAIKWLPHRLVQNYISFVLSAGLTTVKIEEDYSLKKSSRSIPPIISPAEHSKFKNVAIIFLFLSFLDARIF